MKFMHRHTEAHRSDRIGWLRAAVLGANDGIVSTASLLIGVAAANASHATLLVTGMAGLMAGEVTEPGPLRRTGLLLDSARALLSLVNDILDLAKLEAGKMRIDRIDFDLLAVVDGVAAMLAVKAEEKGLKFHCFADCGAPPRVHGDPDRLRQVLVNLVGNAIKFTAVGGVTVRVPAKAACAAL